TVIEDDLRENRRARPFAPGRGPHALVEEVLGVDVARADTFEIAHEARHRPCDTVRPRTRIAYPEEVDGFGHLVRPSRGAHRARVDLRTQHFEAACREGGGDAGKEAWRVLRDDANLTDLRMSRGDKSGMNGMSCRCPIEDDACMSADRV